MSVNTQYNPEMVDGLTPYFVRRDFFAESGLLWAGGVWEPGVSYPKNALINDAGWLMRANKQTSERAAPVPDGDPFWFREVPGTPPGWTSQNANVSHVMSGIRVSTSKGGYINTFAYWIPAANVGGTRQMWLVTNPTTNPAYQQILAPATITGAMTGDWIQFSLGNIPVFAGVTFDLLLIVEPAASTTSWSADWDYKDKNGDPDASDGEVWHQSGGQLRFSHDDGNGTDRESQLSGMSPGDEISAGGVTWEIVVVDNQATHTRFDVTPTSRLSEGIYNFTFTEKGTAPVYWSRVVNWYNSTATIDGLVSTTGYENITVDDNLYGVDIEVQDYDSSDDWDYLALTSGSGGGSSGGGWTYLTAGTVVVNTAPATSYNAYFPVTGVPSDADAMLVELRHQDTTLNQRLSAGYNISNLPLVARNITGTNVLSEAMATIPTNGNQIYLNSSGAITNAFVRVWGYHQ